jgi:hypothetical protein
LLFRALGLATLREQQEHFDCVYYGIERPISDKLQSFFDCGTREELNAFSQPSSMYVSCGKYTGTIFPSNVPKAFNSSLVPQSKKDCSLSEILLDAKDSSITKQRTDRWLQLRKESRVTGSTLFRALGLATLREQQEHFDCVYYGIETF